MTPLTAAAVEQQISNDIATCESLLELLDEEQKALKEREVDKLEEIIQKKATQLTSLEKSALTRKQWSQQHGIEANSESWQEYLSEFKKPSIVEKWHNLKKLLENCQNANEVNGKLLVRSQEVFTRISGMLRGQNQNLSLYGASGRSLNAQNSHKLGEV